jgi:hypothetical protein
MIPHAITNTGSYVDLWSQLKAIQHALHRASNNRAQQLTELDRELLGRLAEIVRNVMPEEEKPTAAFTNHFDSLATYEAKGSLDFDLRYQLKNTPEFETWLSTQKQGFEKKIQRLIVALENYVRESRQGLLADRFPDEEFKVLNAIISRLLVQVESALNA